jgi:hypothetical protein
MTCRIFNYEKRSRSVLKNQSHAVYFAQVAEKFTALHITAL